MDEYILSYTAEEIDEKLGKIDGLATEEYVDNAIAKSNEIFLIGDVTTTEEVSIISFDTETPCKKIFANLIVPKDISLNNPCIVFNCETTSVWGEYGNNINSVEKVKRYYMECELIKGYGVKYYFASNGESQFNADFESGALVTLHPDAQELTHFHVTANFAQATFPIGVRLTVWGISA